ncbi:hypothetical protein [Haloferula sp. BvORR071]|nr:hypothetical protein [Haloferula sp. BvORR071]
MSLILTQASDLRFPWNPYRRGDANLLSMIPKFPFNNPKLSKGKSLKL